MSTKITHYEYALKMISLLQSLLLPRFLFFVHFFSVLSTSFSFFSLPLLPAPLLRLLFYLLCLAFSLSPPLPSPSRCPLSLSLFLPISLPPLSFFPLLPSLTSSLSLLRYHPLETWPYLSHHQGEGQKKTLQCHRAKKWMSGDQVK